VNLAYLLIEFKLKFNYGKELETCKQIKKHYVKKKQKQERRKEKGEILNFEYSQIKGTIDRSITNPKLPLRRSVIGVYRTVAAATMVVRIS